MIGSLKSLLGSRRGKLLAILLIAAVVVIGVSIFSNRPDTSQQQRAASNPSGYRTVADQFMKALVRNDAAGTFRLMTEIGKQDVGGIEKWTATMDESFAKAKVEPVFLSEHAIDDPTGAYRDREPKLLTYRLEMFDANWETSLTIIKDGESWKVDRVGTERR